VVIVFCRPWRFSWKPFSSRPVSSRLEIGDKTQLLALVLAARFRKPVPIILGILAATLVNHALAGVVGGWLASTVGTNVMRWILGVSFIAMAIWTLIPDKYDESATLWCVWHHPHCFLSARDGR
jgi:Ca2+/H+ antiporter, TMEM165/GDT1 family